VKLNLGRDRRGFTLIELMVVMVVIAILATAVMLSLGQRTVEAKRTRALSDLHELDQALEMLKIHVGRYPATEEGLQALLTAPALDNPDAWQGPYLSRRKTVPKDPWGHEYVYRCPGEEYPESFDLYSLGADGAPGGQGADADVNLTEE